MKSVAKGLLDSGFSNRDYRLATDRQTRLIEDEEFIDITNNPTSEGDDNQSSQSETTATDPVDLIDPEKIKTAVEEGRNDPTTTAAVDSEAIRLRMEELEIESITETQEREVPIEMSDGKTTVNPYFKEELESTVIPYLLYKEDNYWSKLQGVDYHSRVSREGLSNDFDVSKRCDVDIGDSFVDDKMGKLDARADNPDILTFSVLQEKERDYALSIMDPGKMSDHQLSKSLADDLFKSLSPMNNVKDRQLRSYLDYFVSRHSRDDLILYRKFFPQVVSAIKRKINSELERYRKERYDELMRSRAIFCDLNDPKGCYRFPERIDPRNGLRIPPTIDKALYASENEVSGFESTMLRRIIGCETVLWWHRIAPSNKSEEFFINGFINHYPDFIVKTKKGNIVLIETKGSHLDNPDTRFKIELGRDWTASAGPGYFYFMVFEDEQHKAEGSISASEMIKTLSNL